MTPMQNDDEQTSQPGGTPVERDVGRLEPERCEYCNDTGDVTGFDGEWRGYCVCDAGHALKAWGKPPCQQCGAMTADDALSRCMGARAEGGCHGNDLWPD